MEGISLDEFVYGQGNPPPQVVKMDIEGGEVLALPGMARVLAEARPLLLMELHGQESSRAAWESLTAAGYKICWMRGGFPSIAFAGRDGLESLYRRVPTFNDMKRRPDTFAFLWLALVLVHRPVHRLPPAGHARRITGGTCGWGGIRSPPEAVPRVDTFTFTQAGAPVDYQSWGAAVIF